MDGQWATDLNALSYPTLCPFDKLKANVVLKRLDMHSIPPEHCGYDFTWSCCALEHLGNLQNGLDFLVRQMSCLRPGGVAVHTTEFNLLSNTATVTEGATVAYRAQDIFQLAHHLGALGHSLSPLDLYPGDSMEDWFVAHKPWDDREKNLAHLRLLIENHVCTSVILIAMRGVV